MTKKDEKSHYDALDDVHVNLDNRNHAIEDYGYGPLNPNESSDAFWKKKAALWETSVDEARKSVCGNCAAFNRSQDILTRIAAGLGPAGDIITEKAGLGFCEMFEFKCAAQRTCDAWLVNGPITEEEGGVATNNVGAGNIAGLGVGSQGEPGVRRRPRLRRNKKRLRPVRRILQSPIFESGTFAGEQTLIVPTELFESLRTAKSQGNAHFTKYLTENDDLCFLLRDSAYAQSNRPLIFEDKKTGHMLFARYGKKTKGD